MLRNIFKRKGVFKGFVLITAALMVIAAVSFNNAIEIRWEEAKKGSIRELIELQGIVKLENSETVFAKIPGFVDEIRAAEGDTVDGNSKLMQLSVEDLDFAIGKAQAAYDASKANLTGLKKSIKPEHIKLSEAQLEQAKAVYAAALKDYENKNENFLKVKTLYERDAISEKDLKDSDTLQAAAESSLENAEQGVNIAQYNLDILKDGVPEEAIRAAEANVTAAKVQLDELYNNKGKTNIYSPIEGTILAKYIEKGAVIQPGTPLYEIGDYDSAYISVDVLIEDIRKISKGQKVIISGDAVDDKEIPGDVYFIASRAVSKVSSLGVAQQRIEVRVKFDNSRLRLKPGYSLDVDIIASEKPSTVYISDKAVFELDGNDTVFVVKNNRLELREVECGIENEDFTEILSGLEDGELVVVDPENELKPGKKVRLKKQNSRS